MGGGSLRKITMFLIIYIIFIYQNIIYEKGGIKQYMDLYQIILKYMHILMEVKKCDKDN